MPEERDSLFEDEFLNRSSQILPSYGVEARDPMPVVVYSHQGHRVGLIVDRILDITDEAATARCAAGRADVLGSAVIQGHVADLLDIDEIVRRTDPVWA